MATATGICFDLPEQIDRCRLTGIQATGIKGRYGDLRPLQTPNRYWEYNDVRIIQFFFALMHLFERSIPDVLREYSMQTPGSSEFWKWPFAAATSEYI